MATRVSGALLALLAFAAAATACGPAAPTTTAKPVATATRSSATATTAAPVQPTRPADTATPLRVATTATVAVVKNRPVPVLAPPPPNPRAQQGGTFRWLAEAASSDRTIWSSANGTTLQTAVLAYGSLLDRNEFEPNKGDQIIASLAYDWWTDQSGTLWTFKLRENVKFTDGVEMTCKDVKFSLETIRDGRDAKGSELSASPRRSWLGRMKEVQCPDNYTAVLRTDGPMPSIIPTLAVSSFAIMPQHIFEGKLEKMLNQVGPGQGPFMQTLDVPGEILKYGRNPNYWNQPYPYLSEFHYSNLGSVTAVRAAYRVGRGERGSLTKAVRDQMEKEGKLTVLNMGAAHGFVPWHANWLRQPWGDKRFSLAMRCTIDGAKYISTVADGEGYEVPMFPMADQPGGSPWSLTLEEWMAIGPCYGPTAKTDMTKRREIARALLKELGFGPDNPARPRAMERKGSENRYAAIEADLREVGILPTVEFFDVAGAYSKAQAGDWDIGTPAGFVTSRLDPDHWYGEHFHSTSDRNYGKYVNAEVDALIDQQSRTLDKEKRYKIIKQLDIILLRDNAKIIVATNADIQHTPSWVNDIYWGQPSNSQNTSAKFERVWIDAAKMKQVLGQ